MARDTLLVVGAGLLHCYTIREAQAMGLCIVVTDKNRQAPGLLLADGLVIDTSDIDMHRQIAKHCQETLCGVTCAGGDNAPTVAAVAEAAGLPGIPYVVAEKTWNKGIVRRDLHHAQLFHYQPQWAVCGMAYGAETMIDETRRYWGGSLIVKPLHQRASRGVTCIQDASQAAIAFARLKEADQGAKGFLMEEQLAGSEHSAEIVLDAQGQLCHFHVCDRFFDYSTGIPLELGHINPSCLAPAQQAAIKTMLLETAAAMGVTIGSWKCDVMWTADGPKILECAARCSGGFDAQVSYPRSSGDNLLRRVIQVACGLPVTPQPALPTDRYCAIAAIMAPKAGTVDHLPALCYNEAPLWLIQEGSVVRPPQHNAERVGFVVVEGTDYADTWEQAQLWAQAYQEALEEVIV